MESRETLENITKLSISQVDRIQVEATLLCKKHRDQVMKTNLSLKDWRVMSILVPRVRRRNNSLTLEWTEVRWIGTKANNTRQALLRPLNKKRGSPEYNPAILASMAQDWESEDVMELERKMVEYRKDLQALQGILHQIRLRYRVNPGRKTSQDIDEPLA